MILIAVVLFLVSLLLDRVFGASYFTMASCTLAFLIFLTVYLVLRIFEGPLLKKIRKSIGKIED